jgi:CMP-2-keto-3-deoxyoctulosonic acid synthetase
MTYNDYTWTNQRGCEKVIRVEFSNKKRVFNLMGDSLSIPANVMRQIMQDFKHCLV